MYEEADRIMERAGLGELFDIAPIDVSSIPFDLNQPELTEPVCASVDASITGVAGRGKHPKSEAAEQQTDQFLEHEGFDFSQVIQALWRGPLTTLKALDDPLRRTNPPAAGLPHAAVANMPPNNQGEPED